jgi:asparagine synthase (glutamine-hydrolysing)
MNDTVKSPSLLFQPQQWSASGSTLVRGCGHLEDRFTTAEELASKLDACATIDEWRGLVGRFNGCFAAVTARHGLLLAAVDRVRSTPVFFAGDGGARLVSDRAEAIRSALGEDRVDPDAASEFFLTGYVTGAQTLFRAIRQMPAGSMLTWRWGEGAAPSLDSYYAFRHRDFFTGSTSSLIARLEGVHERVFRRLLEGTAGRPLVIPLSGGYDSRLIGVCLRDLGARDVLCYTYGVPGNWEARISQELAAYLGFRWEFVPYSADRWRTWSSTTEFRTYVERSGNLASTPHVQDWPAVFELGRTGKAQPGAVFAPGHSGDFLAGSHVPKEFALKAHVRRRELLDALLRSHYSLWDWPAQGRDELRAKFEAKIESIAGPIADGSSELAADIFERWDLQERQAKFICNSVRVYEDRGFDWRLPLFDSELMDFWSRVPVDLRIGRKLYFHFAAQRQKLPVTEANQDHGAVYQMAVRAMDALGLRRLGKYVRRVLKKRRWEQEYDASQLAWLALVDRDYFGRTYTGKEIFHAYMARAYLDRVARRFGPDSAATAIAALSEA